MVVGRTEAGRRVDDALCLGHRPPTVVMMGLRHGVPDLVRAPHNGFALGGGGVGGSGEDARGVVAEIAVAAAAEARGEDGESSMGKGMA